MYALILIRVPTAWEARKVRKEKLLDYVKNKIKSANPHLSNTYAAVADGIRTAVAAFVTAVAAAEAIEFARAN